MVCLRYAPNEVEAKDMFQNGLIEIFSHLHQFKPEKGSFSNWSKRVMAHAAIKYLKQRSATFKAQCLDQEAGYTDQAENTDKINSETITRAIQQLPAGYRTVFNMYVLEGYTHREIADYLNISVSTSKSQLHKAKKQLRQWLEVKL
jgi:RNA polymerase sigma-70 factor (ECF subfamily)